MSSTLQRCLLWLRVASLQPRIFLRNGLRTLSRFLGLLSILKWRKTQTRRERRDEGCRRIAGCSLPAGIGSSLSAGCTTLTVHPATTSPNETHSNATTLAGNNTQIPVWPCPSSTSGTSERNLTVRQPPSLTTTGFPIPSPVSNTSTLVSPTHDPTSPTSESTLSGSDAQGTDRPKEGLAEHHKIVPTIEIERYRDTVIPPVKTEECILLPVTLEFGRRDIPEGWVACVHPEGALYFHHSQNRIYTDENVCEPRVRQRIQDIHSRLLDDVRTSGQIRNFPPNPELVIEFWDETTTLYYFVDHRSRKLFWVHGHDIIYYVSGVRGKLSPEHYQSVIEGYYWQHLEYFPHHHCQQIYSLEHGCDELIDHLLWGSADEATSPTTNFPITGQELNSLLNTLKTIRQQCTGRLLSPEAVAIVGRSMSFIYQSRFLNFYGRPGARLNSNQSIHGHVHKQSWMFKILAVLCLNAPFVHLKGLGDIWVDSQMHRSGWNSFVNKMQESWTELVINSAVVLNANVAFLAINNIDSDDGTRGSAATASYMSTIASIGAVVIGLLLVRKHRARPRDSSNEAVAYIESWTHPVRGLETLAILYSLPYALLMWSMATFFIAFSIATFTTKSPYTMIPTGIVFVLILSIIVWATVVTWERKWKFGLPVLKQWMKKVSGLSVWRRREKQTHPMEDVEMAASRTSSILDHSK